MSAQQIICAILSLLVGLAIEHALTARPGESRQRPSCHAARYCEVVQSGPCRRVDRFTILCPRKQVCETRRVCR
jgi:hypothetical protein